MYTPSAVVGAAILLLCVCNGKAALVSRIQEIEPSANDFSEGNLTNNSVLVASYVQIGFSKG